VVVTDLEQAQMARLVRDEHAAGVCDECHGIGPCSRYNLWFPLIAKLPRPEPEWLGGDDAMRWWI